MPSPGLIRTVAPTRATTQGICWDILPTAGGEEVATQVFKGGVVKVSGGAGVTWPGGILLRGGAGRGHRPGLRYPRHKWCYPCNRHCNLSTVSVSTNASQVHGFKVPIGLYRELSRSQLETDCGCLQARCMARPAFC